jgi:hypothetical protein
MHNTKATAKTIPATMFWDSIFRGEDTNEK